MDIRNKVAIVTGAAVGIGRAISERLAHEGAAVALTDINAREGAETLRRIQAAGGRAAFREADITRDSQVQEVVNFAVVQPLSVVDNSDFSPTGLTFPLDGPYASFSEGNGPSSSFQAKRMLHEHTCVSARVLSHLLSGAALCPVLSHPGPVQTRAAAKVRTTFQRLLKPRSPHDCPACRLASTAPSGGGLAPAPVRPWREVKSRRGAPKRVNTEGFACSNQQCAYFGITDASIHALVGDGKHGQAEKIQTFRCQACRTTFTSRRYTPFYRLKTPSQQIVIVLSALAEGMDPSAAERVFGYRQATITTWLSRAGEHAQTLHERFFCHLHLPYLQLDELRTRLRCATQVLWLWLVIDPTTHELRDEMVKGSSRAKK